MAQGQNYNEPFFWHRLVNVGWSGRVAIVTITAAAAYEVQALTPFEAAENIGGSAGTILTRADYSDKGALILPLFAETESVLLEDELVGVIIVDRSIVVSGYVTQLNSEGNTPGLDLFNEEVSLATAIEGRPPELSTIGAIYQTDLTHHVHPNGHAVDYVSGFTQITFSPPDFDWTDSAMAIWYHTTTIPEVRASVIRRSWLVNFGNRGEGVVTIELAGIFATPTTGELDASYVIRLYSSGANFTLNADGSVAADQALVRAEQSGTVPGAFVGYPVTFDKNGVVATLP